MSRPVGILMETTALTFQNLKLWTIQVMKVLKEMSSNYSMFNTGQNSNILIYLGLYSLHCIVFDYLHLLVFN